MYIEYWLNRWFVQAQTINENKYRLIYTTLHSVSKQLQSFNQSDLHCCLVAFLKFLFIWCLFIKSQKHNMYVQPHVSHAEFQSLKKWRLQIETKYELVFRLSPVIFTVNSFSPNCEWCADVRDFIEVFLITFMDRHKTMEFC